MSLQYIFAVFAMRIFLCIVFSRFVEIIIEECGSHPSDNLHSIHDTFFSSFVTAVSRSFHCSLSLSLDIYCFISISVQFVYNKSLQYVVLSVCAFEYIEIVVLFFQLYIASHQPYANR